MENPATTLRNAADALQALPTRNATLTKHEVTAWLRERAEEAERMSTVLSHVVHEPSSAAYPVTLGALFDVLHNHYSVDDVVPFVPDVHVYRGRFERLALTPGVGSAGALRDALARRLAEREVRGYNGGSRFVVTRNTLLHVAAPGETGPGLFWTMDRARLVLGGNDENVTWYA